MCKLFQCSPTDFKILSMSFPERVWFLVNLAKDESQDYEMLKQICMFIRPEAFADQNKEEVIEGISVEEMAERSGGKYSAEEIEALFRKGVNIDTVEEIKPLKQEEDND